MKVRNHLVVSSPNPLSYRTSILATNQHHLMKQKSVFSYNSLFINNKTYESYCLFHLSLLIAFRTILLADKYNDFS